MKIKKFKEEVVDYGKAHGYVPTIFNEQECSCGHNLFKMYSDNSEGGCGISCAKCDNGISVDNSADYMKDIVQNTCTCGNEELYVLVSKALFKNSNNVRWVFVGGMCPKCDLAGVYVDWAER